MANPIQFMPASAVHFQPPIAGPAGSSVASADAKKWENLCGELLLEREKLREELTKSQAECELYRRSLFHWKCRDYTPVYDRELAFAHLDEKPSVEELIAELANNSEK